MKTVNATVQHDVLHPRLFLRVPIFLQREQALLQSFAIQLAVCDKPTRVTHEYRVEPRGKRVRSTRRRREMWRGEQRPELVCEPLGWRARSE